MKLVKLGEVCKFFNGKAHEKKIDTDGKFVVVNSKCISSNFEIKKFSNEQLFPLFKNDIVMVMSDVPNGKALAKCRLIEEDKKYSLNQRIACIRSDNFYIPYLLYQLDRNPYFLKFDNGENQTNLRKDDILNCPLYLPSIEEQQRIVAKLDASFTKIDKAIANDKKTLANIKNLNNKIFDKLLNNSKCKNIFLNDICKVERGSSPRPIKSFLTEKKDGVNWIKIGDTKQDGKYISSTKQKITKDGAKQSRIVKKGDLVLTNSMSYGRPYIMLIDGCIHDGWFVLRLKDDVDSDYFYYLLSSEGVQNQFKSLAAGSVVKNISGDLVKKTKLLIPSKEIQIAIKEKLSIISEHIKRINELTLLKIEYYQKLKISIFKNLIRLNTEEA